MILSLLFYNGLTNEENFQFRPQLKLRLVQILFKFVEEKDGLFREQNKTQSKINMGSIIFMCLFYLIQSILMFNNYRPKVYITI